MTFVKKSENLCSPTFPTDITTTEKFIFRGETPNDQIGSVNQIYEYPIIRIRQNPNLIIAEVKDVYDQEKLQSPVGDSSKTMDLSKPEDLSRMDFHVKVHATTGFVHWGSSTTENIPFWDRQALEEGLKYCFPKNYKDLMLEADIESINCLRGLLAVSVPKYLEAKLSTYNLQNKINGKKHTHKDLSTTFATLHEAWLKIEKDYERVIVAKFKHLLFAIDGLDSEKARSFLLDEILGLIEDSKISSEELSLNLGVDAGISPETYRPDYMIGAFPQLDHLQTDSISVSHDICPTWNFEYLVASICRPENSETLLLTPEEFKLPWKFE